MNPTETQIVINPTLFYWVLGILFTVILSLISVIYNGLNQKIGQLVKRIDHLEKQVEDMSKVTTQIKVNYLDRFAEVNKNINSAENTILTKINEFFLKYARNP